MRLLPLLLGLLTMASSGCVSLNDRMLRAAAVGDAKTDSACLARGADPNYQGMLSRPWWAAGIVNLAEVRQEAPNSFLLDASLNPSSPPLALFTPLVAALGHQGHGATVKALIGAGANVNERAGDSSNGPLNTAIKQPENQEDIAIVKSLIAAGADVNEVDFTQPLLMQAAVHGDPEYVSALLDAGAAPNAGDGLRQTVLMAVYATEKNCLHTRDVRAAHCHEAAATGKYSSIINLLMSRESSREDERRRR